MKIKRSKLEQIIREELAAHIREITEGPPDDLDGPEVVDAEKEKPKKEPKKTPGNTAPDKKANDRAVKPPPAQELPVGDDPEADKDLEKDVATDDEESPEEVTGGGIADEITGKTVQSVTMEPKSKTLPGAQELVITFREIPDPLKVLITKTGQVKFFFRGLHNSVDG